MKKIGKEEMKRKAKHKRRNQKEKRKAKEKHVISSRCNMVRTDKLVTISLDVHRVQVWVNPFPGSWEG